MLKKNNINIKVMGDYSSTSIWDYDTGIMLDYDTLFNEYNIPLNLINRIELFSKLYDKTFYSIEFNKCCNYNSIIDFYIHIFKIKKQDEEISFKDYTFLSKILSNRNDIRKLKKEQYFLARKLSKYFNKVFLFDDYPENKNKHLVRIK